MRHLFLTVFISIISYSLYSQQLGFSSSSPYSGLNNSNDKHKLYYNTGELLINTEALGAITANNGLLQNVAQGIIPNKSIQVRFYFDDNENGLRDGEEKFVSTGAFTINNQSFINYSKDGVILQVPDGTYVISYVDSGAVEYFLTSNADFNITIDTSSQVQNILFGIAPEERISKLNPYMSSGTFRCNSPRNYNVSIANNGTIIEENTLWIKVDERIPNVIFNQPPDIVIDSNYVGYNFELFPTEVLTFDIDFTVPGISNDITVGDFFKSLAWVETAELRSEFCFEQELRCSYDPNDKLVNPNRPDSLALLNNPITYTLRFQNTGNDYAENVVVTDTLSEFLDLSTFKLIETSHPNLLKVENNKDDNRIIDFRFDNIYLPDSTTNPIGSNGHITYTISPLPDLPEGTKIENTGYIYFDFNPAIVTNTTGTTLVESFPTVSNDNLEQALQLIYPNPTLGNIRFLQKVDQLYIRDITGRLIANYNEVDHIDISDLDPGTYIFEYEANGKTHTEKIVLISK
jgi:uncharacterized repeat protein (TIGR01451 family)